MLLQRIVSVLDAELDRLQAIREIIHNLGKSPDVIQSLAPELNSEMLRSSTPQSDAPESTELKGSDPAPVRRRSRLCAPGTRERRARRQPVHEPSALTSAIPAGPVVVSAQALAREREIRAHHVVAEADAAATAHSAVHQVPEPAPDSVVRDLAARWLSGPVDGGLVPLRRFGT